jgi:hypothetical protein
MEHKTWLGMIVIGVTVYLSFTNWHACITVMLLLILIKLGNIG